jgi:hypothetical protein
MKSLTRKLISVLYLLLLITLPSLSQSDDYKKGNSMIEQNSTIEPFTLNDQFGTTHTLEKMPRLLICSFGKGTGKLISSYFNAQIDEYLALHDIKLMADVSGVPSLLRKTIILPKMKKYSFEILLSTESKFSKSFPQKDDMLTVLKIQDTTVIDILFVKDEAELKATIEG